MPTPQEWNEIREELLNLAKKMQEAVEREKRCKCVVWEAGDRISVDSDVCPVHKKS